MSGSLSSEAESTTPDLPTFNTIYTAAAGTGMEWSNYSPDGSEILFTMNNKLYVVKAQPDSQPALFLPNSPINSQTRSDWSSLPNTNWWVAFTDPTSGSTADIYVMDANSLKANPPMTPRKLDITGLKPPNNPFYPSWYPVSNQLLVTRYGAKLSDGGILYQVVFDVTSFKAEATLIQGLEGYYAGMASVSPDGTKIAIAGEVNTGEPFNQVKNTVLILDLSTTPVTLNNLLPQVKVNGNTDYMYGRAPRWSPDGNYIVFRSNYNQSKGGYQNEYIVYYTPSDAYGATPTPLSDATLSAGHPTYSPDGEQIAFPLSGSKQTSLGYIDVPAT